MSAPPLVKICGVRDPATARAAVQAGADLIGVVFYPPSHRFVTRAEARAVSDAAHAANPRALVTGVFVNADAATLNATADDVGLDLIQLGGDEPAELAGALNRPTLGTVRIDSSGTSDEERRFQAWVAVTPWGVLLDAHVPGMYGGAGTVADWFVATDFARRYRVLLAGGLHSGNVARAASRVRPYAVDVSSGVETNGHKDHAKIRHFIAAAKSSAGFAPPTGGST